MTIKKRKTNADYLREAMEPAPSKAQLVYRAIAQSLTEFGYRGVTAQMIQDAHKAMQRGDEKLPHGIIGMFAKGQLLEAAEEKLIDLQLPQVSR